LFFGQSFLLGGLAKSIAPEIPHLVKTIRDKRETVATQPQLQPALLRFVSQYFTSDQTNALRLLRVF
jgi:hypothetical protein